MNKFNLNKALIFNKHIKASLELEKYSNSKIFNKTIKHLDGSSKHSYREEVLQELKESEQYVVTNAKLFTEGVDLPVIDMIALFRNVKSEIDIIQTVGRVQRIDKNNPNKVGYILLPIFVSNIDNIDDELKTNKDLEFVYELINSLKENDEQLRATLEYKKQNNSKSNKSKNKTDEEIENPNFEINYLSNNPNDTSDFINGINEKIAYKIEAVILNKRAKDKSDKEWKELFIDFIKENELENLKTTTKYKNENLGITLKTIRKKYNKATLDEQKQMREFWDCFPDGFIKPQNKTDKEWKELFIEFIKENGIKNLNQNTKFNDENLGSALSNLKTKYKKANPDEQKKMREFWDCFPDGFFGISKETKERKTKERKTKERKTKETKTDKEWKELFIEFIKENGIKNLNQNTKFNDENLGSALSNLKTKYKKSNPDKQKKMREFWDCFPDGFLETKERKTKEEWKELFIEFIKENGIKNLNQNTKFNDENLGSTSNTIKIKYNKSNPDKQKKMREFWDCFPDGFLETKERKTKEEWKELFIEFIKENGIKNLNQNTKFNDENLGSTLNTIKVKYNKSNPDEQKQMRKFWNCFPDGFLDKQK